jgi:hypothetical protein
MSERVVGWIDWAGMAVALAGVLGVAMYGALVVWPLEELFATREARRALPVPTRALLAPWMAPMASMPLIGLWATGVLAPGDMSMAQRRELVAAAGALSWGALLLWSALVRDALSLL